MMKSFCRVLAVVVSILWTTQGLTIHAQNGSSRLRVVVVGLSPQQMDEVKQAVPEAEIIAARGTEELSANIAQADALIGSCSPEVVRAGKRLRWVHVSSAGVENCAVSDLAKGPITLTNAKILHGPEVADHALALLLGLTRKLHLTFPRQLSGEWGGRQYQPIELRGKTALIIGLGGIGTQVAQRAAGFGMRIIAVDPEVTSFANSVERVGTPENLREFLPQADVVIMCAPLTSQTQGMMGAEQFAAMKQGAYFVNIARGKTVNTDALMQALKDGRLAGAGLDVTDPEPLTKGHPLWKMENVIITPHIAGQSDGIGGRRLELIKENLRRFAKGLPLRNTVDKAKGY